MAKPLFRQAGIFEDEKELELLVIDLLCLSKYGLSYIDWDSDALREEITEDFGNIGPITWGRVQSCRLLHASNIFWKEWEVFEKVSSAIAGEFCLFNVVQPLEAEEIAISLDTANKISRNEYSKEVKKYVAASCLNDGLWFFEDPLDIADEALLVHDKEFGIRREQEKVAARLQSQVGYIDSPETFVDVQANHVLAVRKAIEEQRRIVQNQMRELSSHIGGFNVHI